MGNNTLHLSVVFVCVLGVSHLHHCKINKKNRLCTLLEDVPQPPTFLPDTTGWRSLETSMSALEARVCFGLSCCTERTRRVVDPPPPLFWSLDRLPWIHHMCPLQTTMFSNTFDFNTCVLSTFSNLTRDHVARSTPV